MPTNQFEYADIGNYPAQAFETFCCNILSRELRMDIIQTKVSKDGGKDLIIADDDGRITYAQCKAQSGPVGLETMNAFIRVCEKDKVRGLYISTSSFTRDAVKEAKACKVKLLDFGDLCRIGSRIKPRVYHFGPKPPRMMDASGIGSVKITFLGKSKSSMKFLLDGFEEFHTVGPGEVLYITMVNGKHNLDFVLNKAYCSLPIDLEGNSEFKVLPNRIRSGFVYDLDGTVGEFK